MEEGKMIVYCVEVKVLREFEEDFIAATRENRRNTRQEEGNLRFDILRQSDDSGCFFLYEAYCSREAVLAHKQTSHYLEWREKVAPFMAEPRKGISHMVCAPLDAGEW